MASPGAVPAPWMDATPINRRAASTGVHSMQLQMTASKSLELSTGEFYTGRLAGDDGSCVYRCKSPRRRNWSIVSKGEIVGDGGARHQVFLKQFVDRSSRASNERFRRELDAHALAVVALQGCIGVPKIHFVDVENLVIGYEFLEIVSFGELLRRDIPRFEQAFTELLPRLAEILQALTRAADSTNQLFDQKFEDGGTRSLVFRGLDVRNIGLTSGVDEDGMPEMYVFDFESAYGASMEEASARLIVSIALLNWGRPVSRFARGPDLDLLNRAIDHLKLYSSPAAIQKRIEREFSFRMREVKALNCWESTAKKIGIRLLGRRYFNKLDSYAATLVI